MKSILFLIFLTILFLNPLRGAQGTNLKLAVPQELQGSETLKELQMVFAQALAEENIKVEYVIIPSGRSTSQVESGNLDGELFRNKVIAPKFHDIVFSEAPIIRVKMVVVRRADDKNVNIEKQSGAYAQNFEFLDEEVKRRGLKALGVPTTDQGLKMVVNDRVDYFLAPQVYMDELKKTDPEYAAKFSMAPYSEVSVEFHLLLNSRHIGLMPKIEKRYFSYIKSAKLGLLKEVVDKSSK